MQEKQYAPAHLGHVQEILKGIGTMAKALDARNEGQTTALSLRDISIDQLLAFEQAATPILHELQGLSMLIKAMAKQAAKVRSDIEDDRDKDDAVSSLVWFVQHVAEMNQADREDAERITALESRVRRLEQIINKPETKQDT